MEILATVVGGLLAVALLAFIVILYKYNRKLNKELAALKVQQKALEESHSWTTQEYNLLQQKYTDEQKRSQKIISQKKSSETRLGQITEHLVPFLAGVPYDPKNLHFIGNPIDFLHFDFDEGKITFLEIKSGNSRASKRQRTIKSVIEQGQVFYDEIRLNEKGIKIKGKTNA